MAFPLLSSGNYGYPKEQAFRIAVDTITQYVMEHDLTVYLVLYDRDSLAVSRKLFASVEEYIDCLLYTSPSPRDMRRSRMPSSA